MSDSHLNDLCDLSVCVLIACFWSAHVSGGGEEMCSMSSSGRLGFDQLL